MTYYPIHLTPLTYSIFIKGGPKTPGSDDMFKRCVHFYACVCAFASDEKLQEEFAFYLDLNVSNQASTNNDSKYRIY